MFSSIVAPSESSERPSHQETPDHQSESRYSGDSVETLKDKSGETKFEGIAYLDDEMSEHNDSKPDELEKSELQAVDDESSVDTAVKEGMS